MTETEEDTIEALRELHGRSFNNKLLAEQGLGLVENELRRLRKKLDERGVNQRAIFYQIDQVLDERSKFVKIIMEDQHGITDE